MQLSNPQWETFAQHRAAGASQSEAARRANYGKGEGNAGSRIAKHPAVKARITELQQAQPEKAPEDIFSDWTDKPRIVMELVGVHRLAKTEKQFGICVNVLLALARIGKWIDSTPGPRSVTQNVNFNGMTKEQINSLMRQSFGALPDEDKKQLAATTGEVMEAEFSEPEKAESDPAW